MENVFGCDGFLPNSALGESKVFRNSPVEVMGNHHHIERLIKRIRSVWPRWSRRSWNYVWFAADLDDVRGMSATGSFRMKCMNGPALEGCDCIFDEAAFVERVGMNKNLHVHVICDRQAGINSGGCRTPVLMKLQAAGPRLDLFNETYCRARITLTEETEIHREGIGGLEHPQNVPGTWSTCGCVRPYRGSCASAHHRGQARIKSFFDLLRADVMNVSVNAAGRNNLALAGDHFSSGAEHAGCVRLDIRVPGFPDRGYPTIFDSDIRLHDPPVIENQGVRNYRVDCAFTARSLGLAHTVANHLPAAKLHLLAVDRIILVHLDEDIGICKAHFVADCGAKHLRIGSSVHFVGHVLYLIGLSAGLP